MSVDLYAAVLWLPLPPTQKLVLSVLAERADLQSGLCWPGREEIEIRASVSGKTATDTLKALKAAGWIRRDERSNRRLGGTTRRWLDVDRILDEAGKVRADLMEKRRLKRLSEESSPNPFQPSFLGEDGDALSEVDDGLSVISDGLGEAASLGSVRSDPSIQNRQHDPSTRASETPRADVGLPEHSEASKPIEVLEHVDRETVFVRIMAQQIRGDDWRTYFADAGVELDGDRIVVSVAPKDCAMVRTVFAPRLKTAARAAGIAVVEVQPMGP